MALTNFAIQEITRLLKQKKCNQDQIKLALDIIDYYVVSKSGDCVRDTTKEDLRRLESAKKALKQAEISLKGVNPHILADVNDRAEYYINNDIDSDINQEQPLIEPSPHNSFVNSTEFITKLIHSIQTECDLLSLKKANQSLTERIADCWIHLTELFSFELKKTDLHDFAHYLTEENIDTLKSRFSYIKTPKEKEPEYLYERKVTDSKILMKRERNPKYVKPKERKAYEKSQKENHKEKQ